MFSKQCVEIKKYKIMKNISKSREKKKLNKKIDNKITFQSSEL
jgi:hypothetical protein